MEVISKTNKFKAVIRKSLCTGHKIGFVPTMGALHEGHLSLVRRACDLSDVVVVSIFINPTQFGPSEDYEAYPRNLSHDVELLSKLDVDYVFAPAVEEIYPKDFQTSIEVDDLSSTLCGLSRPGHFQGVTTVVSKLFSIVQPTYAFFGQKDAQQAIIIRKMSKDLNFSVEIKISPIVRETDGMAMSSRNAHLSPAERAAAAVLYRSLRLAAGLVLEGEREADRICRAMRDEIAGEPLARIDYVDIVDTTHLSKLDTLKGEALIALSVFIGKIRLIDNILVSIP